MSFIEGTEATPSKKRTRNKESLSDSDLEVHPVKGRKVLRTRVIGSDSGDDAEPIVLSDSPREVSNKVQGKKARARRLEKLDKLEDKLEDSFESTKVIFTDCPTHFSYVDLK